MKKKPKKGAKPDAKPITKTEPVDSFFNFFNPPQVRPWVGEGPTGAPHTVVLFVPGAAVPAWCVYCPQLHE